MEFLDNIVLEYAQTFIPEMWSPWTVEAISTVCHSGILEHFEIAMFSRTIAKQMLVTMENSEYFKMLKYDRVSYSGYHLYTP